MNYKRKKIRAIRIPEFRHPNVSVPWLGMRNEAYMITNALTHDCGILNSREWMATNVTEWWHRKMHVNRSSLILSTNTLVYQVREGTQILKLTYQRCSYKLSASSVSQILILTQTTILTRYRVMLIYSNGTLMYISRLRPQNWKVSIVINTKAIQETARLNRVGTESILEFDTSWPSDAYICRTIESILV